MKKLFAMCLIISLLSACKKKDQNTPTETLEGYVFLHNEFGQYQQNNAGVTISVVNGPTATSDSSGKFTIPNSPINNSYSNLPTDYTITYSKSGYGACSTIYIDSSHLASIDLYAIPTTIVTGLKAKVIDFNNGTITVTVTISPPGAVNQPRSVVLFWGSDSTVSSTNYEELYYLGEITSDTLVTTSYTLSYVDPTYIVAYGVACNSGFLPLNLNNNQLPLNQNLNQNPLLTEYPAINPNHSVVVKVNTH